MPTWTCPRCRGTDGYNVTEQQVYNGVIARDEWNAKDIYGAKVREVSVKKCRQCAEKMRLEVTADDKEIFQVKMLQRVRETFKSEADKSIRQSNPSDVNTHLIEKDVDDVVSVFRMIFKEKISAFSESDYLNANQEKLLSDGMTFIYRDPRFQEVVNNFRSKYPDGSPTFQAPNHASPVYQSSSGFPVGFIVFTVLAIATILIFGLW